MHDQTLQRDDRTIAVLEALWGEGFLSPGGPEEVGRVLEGLDLAGARVIDIGCGTGGITCALAARHGAAEVTGIDGEAPVCAAARARVARQGLEGRVTIRQVAPGPLPFPDASFDVVFSKDAIVHIADKEGLAREVFRVPCPGGWFAASDWLIAHAGGPSPAMRHYIACEDLDFGMPSPARYAAALKAAGFAEVRLLNRNPRYREEAARELARLTGRERAAFEALTSPAGIAGQIRTREAMRVVLESGGHCPHHIRARKPA
jgi:phosphoethanolamine N-methyltransferase